MEKIINWLMGIEHYANEVYSLAAQKIRNDEELSSFFESIAEDEALHYHVMASAAKHFEAMSLPVPAIEIDNKTSDKIKGFFSELSTALDSRSIDKEILLEKIATVEFSEWNDIFLYVVNCLKKEIKEFVYPAARIQAHRKNIELFCARRFPGSEWLKSLKKIPDIWTENILIVDDEVLIAELLKALLSTDGSTDIASNGEEALKKIEEKFYKLIISDVSMPIMDGISLYEKAVEKFPTLTSRFIFISGHLSTERHIYFKENDLPFLLKPMSIHELRQQALKILLSE